MQKIRQATKKHRTLILVIVIILCLGMVASFSYWNSDQNQTAESYSDYVQQYQKYIQQIEKPKLERNSYDNAVQLSQLYYYVYMYSLYSYYLEGQDEAMLTTSNEALLSAATYANYAAEKYGAKLGECSFEDAITVYQNYAQAYNFEYYLSNGSEDSEYYEDYCTAMKNSCDWLEYAMSVDTTTLDNTDYDTVSTTYQYWGYLYSTSKSYYDATQEESYNELYKSSIHTAYDWLQRCTELYDTSALTAETANTLYQQYDGLASLAKTISTDLEDAAYTDLYPENLVKAYDVYVQTINLTISEAEASESGLTAENANSVYTMYQTLAGISSSIYGANQDQAYAARNVSDLGQVCDWYQKYLDMYVANAEAAEGGLTADAAASISSMYTTLQQEALSAWTAGSTAYESVYKDAGESSISYYQQSIDLSSGKTEAEMAQMYIKLYGLYATAADMDNAKKALDQAIALAPDDIEVIKANGEYLYSLESDPDAAVAYLQSKLSVFAEDSSEHTTLSDLITLYSVDVPVIDETATEGEAGTEGENTPEGEAAAEGEGEATPAQ